MSDDIDKQDRAEAVDRTLDLDALAQEEAQTRPERISRLTAEVERLFPGEALAEFRQDIIQRSFNVPQWGEYHNEGIFMDTHLVSIFKEIENIGNGKFHPDLPEEVRVRLSGVVAGNKDSLQKYVLTHDISKADTLTIKDATTKKRTPISWEDWEKSLPAGVQGNPVAMRAHLKSIGAESIGYPSHGKPGAAKVQALREHLDVPDVLVTAIKNHEVAFNFNEIDTQKYSEFFGNLSEEEISWVMTASYIDTMSSLRANGQPDIGNYLNMLESKKLYETWKALKAELTTDGKTPVSGLDKRKLDSALLAIERRKQPMGKDYAAVLAELKTSCKISIYDKEKLKSALQALVTTGQLDQAQAEGLVAALDEHGQLDARKFGPIKAKLSPDLQALVMAAFEGSEIKETMVQTSPVADKVSTDVGKDAADVVAGKPSFRQRRIEDEDRKLSASPKQRQMAILDYIRRGNLFDNIEIMPELVDLTPDLLDQNMIDVSGDNYDPKKTLSDLIRVFAEFETEVKKNDQKIRDFLAEQGLKIKDETHYLDEEWYEKNIGNTFDILLQPKSPKNPQSDEDYAAAQYKKVLGRLNAVLEGGTEAGDDSMARFVETFRTNKSGLNLDLSRDQGNAIKDFAYSKKPKVGFYKFPKLSEYKGEVIEEPPDMSNQRMRPNLHMIARDSVPKFKGGVILDGNFGYDEKGNPIMPEDKLIIDHHDKFDHHTHDTATNMVFALLADPARMADLESDRYRDEQGNLPIMTNNIDSDAISSTWIMYHRNDPFFREVSTRTIVRNIVWCGDFLLGTKVMEHGATARDYEYIVKDYLKATQDKVKALRVRKVQEELEAKNLEMKGVADLLKALEDEIKSIKSTDQEIIAKEQSLKLLMTEGRSADGTVLQGKEKGQAIGLLRREVDELVALKVGSKAAEEKELRGQMAAIGTEVEKLRKRLERAEKDPLTQEDNLIALNHMHDVMKDIILNPFKYKKFLLEGRAREKRTVDATDAQYRKGDIEITPDAKDKDILVLRPLGLKELPTPENFDGLYFYFRGREDFNKELILTIDGNTYMMAINTQNMNGLNKYDFNLLIDDLRTREAELIAQKISEKEAELAVEGADQKKVGAELAQLRKDQDRNDRGQLWRSRTQMVFCFRSYISETEMKEMIYRWKEIGTTREEVGRKAERV